MNWARTNGAIVFIHHLCYSDLSHGIPKLVSFYLKPMQMHRVEWYSLDAIWVFGRFVMSCSIIFIKCFTGIHCVWFSIFNSLISLILFVFNPWIMMKNWKHRISDYFKQITWNNHTTKSWFECRQRKRPSVFQVEYTVLRTPDDVATNCNSYECSMFTLIKWMDCYNEIEISLSKYRSFHLVRNAHICTSITKLN